MIKHSTIPHAIRPTSNVSRLVAILSVLVLVAVFLCTMFTSVPHAYAAVDPPTCTQSACSGQNPYLTYCAGQTWDSWRVLATSQLSDKQGEHIGQVALWYSATCQTYWTSTTIHLKKANALLYIESDLVVGGRAVESRATTEPNTRLLLSPQYYAPGALATASGVVAIQTKARVFVFTGQTQPQRGH